MSTVDLISKIKKTSRTMSKTQRKNRLVKAHIIKDNGEYDPKYFSAATVKTSKRLESSL
ncbi:hypothetical protein KKA17_07125 [bacterium]|nr:hypothetical protein [bacterium]MBU1883355.1 hypothetical protein [bacterium]